MEISLEGFKMDLEIIFGCCHLGTKYSDSTISRFINRDIRWIHDERGGDGSGSGD